MCTITFDWGKEQYHNILKNYVKMSPKLSFKALVIMAILGDKGYGDLLQIFF
jgi:hypothetical protein